MKEWIKETRINFYSLCEYIYSSKSATYKEKNDIEELRKEFEENMKKIEQGHTRALNGALHKDIVLNKVLVALSYYDSVKKRENNTKER